MGRPCMYSLVLIIDLNTFGYLDLPDFFLVKASQALEENVQKKATQAVGLGS